MYFSPTWSPLARHLSLLQVQIDLTIRYTSPEDRLRDQHRVLLTQLRHLERLRVWLPSEGMAPTGSVLSTVSVAVLEETTEIRRRISLVTEVLSWGLLPDHAALLEYITEAGEWAVPSKKEIW